MLWVFPCLCPWVTPSSHNRLSTLEAGFSHNPERITQKANNKHILLLNSWLPSASDLPDRPWQPVCLEKGWLGFLQPSLARSHPACAASWWGGRGHPATRGRGTRQHSLPYLRVRRHKMCSSALCS